MVGLPSLGMSTADAASLVVPARFAGPPGIGNGGWVSGRLAEVAVSAGVAPASGPVQVTLRQPTPLDVALDVRADDDGRVTLGFGGALLAEATTGSLAGDPVDAVDAGAAASAMLAYEGLGENPYRACFVCGVDRPAPDGLGLRPGRLPDRRDTVASTWLPDAGLVGPDGLLPVHVLWAALDCPGGWSADLVQRPMLLGRMTATVDARPTAGELCVVVGRHLGDEGRKTFTASTAYDGDGRILARAESVWIAIDALPPTPPTPSEAPDARSAK